MSVVLRTCTIAILQNASSYKIHGINILQSPLTPQKYKSYVIYLKLVIYHRDYLYDNWIRLSNSFQFNLTYAVFKQCYYSLFTTSVESILQKLSTTLLPLTYQIRWRLNLAYALSRYILRSDRHGTKAIIPLACMGLQTAYVLHSIPLASFTYMT